jgi:putative phosphoesterase
VRIAAISDIHGNLDALRAVLDDIEERGCDLVVNLGDIVSGPLQPAQTAELLMTLRLPTIRGNHERQLLAASVETMKPSDAFARQALAPDQLAWIEALPATLRLSDDVLLCHGTPASDVEYFLEHVDANGWRRASVTQAAARAGDCNAGLILCGHTHVPRAMQLDDGRLVVNPGSVGLQAFHADHPLPHDIELDSPHARYAIATRTRRGWSVEFHAVDYDTARAVALAERRGRPEWATALRRGRMH